MGKNGVYKLTAFVRSRAFPDREPNRREAPSFYEVESDYTTVEEFQRLYSLVNSKDGRCHFLKNAFSHVVNSGIISGSKLYKFRKSDIIRVEVSNANNFLLDS